MGKTHTILYGGDFMNFLKRLFSKEICVAVYVTNEDIDTFDGILLDSVKRYKVDRVHVGDDLIFAFRMTEYRYQIMVDACAEAGIPLAVYSKVKYFHRIVK